MKNYSFFALAFRMKYINRWGLMRNTQNENLTEHSCECAMISHALAQIGNTYFGKDYDADRIAVCALYHDISEIYTGDLPTPVKYFNETIRDSYKMIEKDAVSKALSKLPDELKTNYASVLDYEQDKDVKTIVKSADKLCAYLKCVQEYKNGNLEFKQALKTTEKTVMDMAKTCQELEYFMQNFAKPFEQSIDEL